MENKRKIMNGFILLNSIECDFEKIKSNLKKDWNIDVSHEKIEKGTLAFDIGENLLALSFIPVPVPNEEAEKNAVNNYLWHNGVEETKKHTAQIIAAVMGDNPYSVGIYFNKLVSSVLKLSNAIGIYKYPTVLSAEEYIEAAGYLNEGEFPIANMIYIGLYNSEKGMCGYTEGMEFFGKKEIEALYIDRKKRIRAYAIGSLLPDSISIIVLVLFFSFDSPRIDITAAASVEDTKEPKIRDSISEKSVRK